MALRLLSPSLRVALLAGIAVSCVAGSFRFLHGGYLFDLWRSEQKYALVGDWLQINTPAPSCLMSRMCVTTGVNGSSEPGPASTATGADRSASSPTATLAAALLARLIGALICLFGCRSSFASARMRGAGSLSRLCAGVRFRPGPTAR